MVDKNPAKPRVKIGKSYLDASYHSDSNIVPVGFIAQRLLVDLFVSRPLVDPFEDETCFLLLLAFSADEYVNVKSTLYYS